MAFWEVRAVLQSGDRFWENVYHIQTDGDSDVSTDALNAIIEFYVTRTLSVYTIVKLVRRLLGTADSFIETSVDEAGTFDAGSSDLLPLWNTIRVVLNSASGRNGLKFLRGMALASQLTATEGQWDPSLITAVQTAWTTMENAIEATTGQHLVFGAANKIAFSGDVQSTVQMRQRHRKRRRSA